MTSSIYSTRYAIFKELLILYRKSSGLTQQKLADKLNRPQSYVSKYESGERRLDIVEFMDIAEALQFDKHEFFKELERRAVK